MDVAFLNPKKKYYNLMSKLREVCYRPILPTVSRDLICLSQYNLYMQVLVFPRCARTLFQLHFHSIFVTMIESVMRLRSIYIQQTSTNKELNRRAFLQSAFCPLVRSIRRSLCFL